MILKRWNFVVAAPLLLAVLSGCATRGHEPVAQTDVFAKTLSTSTETKRKLILLPPDVNLFELSASGQRERVPEWNNQARTYIEKAIREAMVDSRTFEMAETPKLGDAEQASLDEHLALYTRVGGEAFAKTSGFDTAWKHKKVEFDYTLGKGLAFLRERTGAEAALVAVASDTYRSTANKVLTGLVMVAGAAAGVVIVPGSTPAFLSVGLIDLNSGDIQWLNYAAQGAMTDLREAVGAKSLVTATLRPLFHQSTTVAK